MSHPLRALLESKQLDTIENWLADDVVFTSPVAFAPYPGKPVTAAILRAVVEVFDDFRYVREISAPDGRNHALVFEATVDGLQIAGCDFLHSDSDGKIDEFTVMVRPLSAARALATRMAEKYPRIQQEARATTASRSST